MCECVSGREREERQGVSLPLTAHIFSCVCVCASVYMSACLCARPPGVQGSLLYPEFTPWSLVAEVLHHGAPSSGRLHESVPG